MAASPLEVKVIYDASRATRKRSVAPRSTPSRASGPSKFRTVLPFLNLALALSAYYFTWWKADPFIYLRIMMKTPIRGVDAAVVAGSFLRQDRPAVRRAPQREAESVPSQPDAPLPLPADDNQSPETATASSSRFEGETAMVLIPATAYTWLVVFTLAICALALSGGAGLGVLLDDRAQRIGAILTIGVLLGIAYWILAVLLEVGTAYKPTHLRWFMLGVVALAATLGVIKHQRFKLFTTLAGTLIIVAGLATTAGLWLWKSAGAIEPQYASVVVLVAAFIAVSLWGWLLLPVSRRVA